MPNRLLFLRPPPLPQTEDEEEQRKYRAKVAAYHYKLSMVMLALIVFTGWALSPLGLARAQNVKPQIQEALAPVEAEVQQLKTILAQVTTNQELNAKRLTRSLSNSVASEMRFMQAKRCKLSNAEEQERERLWNEIERKQDEYQELRNERYNLPNCAEL